MKIPIPTLGDPLMAFRFSVVFLGRLGLGHPLDLRFQEVSGLKVAVDTEDRATVTYYGSARKYPTKLQAGELTLKRGMSPSSSLRREMLESFNNFRFKPRDVLISVMDEGGLPVSNWLLKEAYPTSWSLDSLNATENKVLIEIMTLTYANCKRFSL